MTPADTLVTQYPTRITQLQGPVYAYLKQWMPYNNTEQDLYMAVFHPISRRSNPDGPFLDRKGNVDPRVSRDNPGIDTPHDYINLVNAKKNSATLTAQEWTALKNLAKKINVPVDSLYKLINFESSWNPQAKNPKSGARGLIQFMPSTAADMGYAATGSIATLIILIVAGWFLVKKYL